MSKLTHAEKKLNLYLDIAERVAQESYCKRLQVGAIIVKDGNIISFGYNGAIAGTVNKCEEYPAEEIWQDTSYLNYQVSSLGKVKRLATTLTKKIKKANGTVYIQNVFLEEKELGISCNKKGYPVVKINSKNVLVHQLVAKAFIKNPDYSYYNQINHIDGNKNNNNVTNLEWCTNRYNCEERSKKTHANRELPLGVYLDKTRPNTPYIGRIYANNKIQMCRFVTIEEAEKFVNYFKNSKDYKTFRYDTTNFSTTLPSVLHAESNAITKACKSPISTEGATMYLTHSCCLECAKLIIQSGIKKVYYLQDYRDKSGINLLKNCDIDVVKINKKSTNI